MAFISVFDVLGPNMIGPSSSHTAGACVIAFLARKMIGGNPKKVELYFTALLQRLTKDMVLTEHCLADLWDLAQMM